MSKIKVTQKEIKNTYKNIIVVPYCDLYYILRTKSALFYNAGTYGWNCDIFHINSDTAIVTGYRTFGNIRNHEIIAKYNKLQDKANKETDYNKRQKKLEKLLDKFIAEILS